MQHTETPWKLIKDGCEHTIVKKNAKEGDEFVLATSEWLTLKDEDAAFIVKACNNHEMLVDALEKALYALHVEHSIMDAKSVIEAAIVALAKE